MNDTNQTQSTTVETSTVPLEGSAENFANLPAVQVFHPSVLVANGQIRVNSRQVADDFGKRHDDVLKKIRDLDCSAAFNLRNFAEISYIDGMNREQKMVEIRALPAQRAHDGAPARGGQANAADSRGGGRCAAGLTGAKLRWLDTGASAPVFIGRSIKAFSFCLAPPPGTVRSIYIEERPP